MIKPRPVEDAIAQIPEISWKAEMEATSVRYHIVAALAAIIFDPVFAITDYFNIPESWKTLLAIRVSISAITLATLLLRKKFGYPSFVIVIVPFILISVQNAFTYMLISNEDLLGHNLNYMALLIGAAMFLAWEARYSLIALAVSAIATATFLSLNPSVSIDKFFVNGGLLVIAVSAFMFALIKTRYDLTVKEIKARLALEISRNELHQRNEEVEAQAEKIKAINDNLEQLVQQRTLALEKKNKALEDYAFINAHKLRSPVASILGLTNLAAKLKLDEEGNYIFSHLKKSTEKLDSVVKSITKTIEKAEFE